VDVEELASSTELVISFSQSGRPGHGKVMAKVADEVVFVDKINIHKEADRIRVADKLASDHPGIDAEAVAATLLEYAGKMTEPPLGSNGCQRVAVPPPDSLYQIADGCLCRSVLTFNGSTTSVPLCNFNAWITEEVIHDDGVEQSRRLVLEGSLVSNEPLPPVEVSPEEFARGDWPLIRWGPHAVVYAGQGNKDHLRTAIQLLSERPLQRIVHTFTGWCRIGEQWVYLHAGGAVGPVGPPQSISVELPDALSHYRLPDPLEGEVLIAAVQSSLDLAQGLAPDQVVLPLLATTYRSVLPEAAFSTHVSGRTGSGKTELAALMQQHFGAEMTAKNLPANWSSTGNALEATAFAAKDALLVVDDFCPTGNHADIARYHKEADRLFRAQGNRSGRQRLRPDGRIKTAKPPRGLILSTGEDIPRGHSLRARLLVVEVGAEDVNFERLTACQQNAAAGLYARAMAVYLKWLAPQFEAIKARLKTEAELLRSGIPTGLQRITLA
jgi:hypothetical protein